MGFGGPPAIYLHNSPPVSHRFNLDVIGQGRDYLKEIEADDVWSVRIRAGVPWTSVSSRLLFLNVASVGCRIATDIQPTVFQGNIADQLHLQPLNPFPHHVSTFLRSDPGWWCKHKLWVALGPGYMPLEVWFPVEIGPRGWQWRYGFPQWNVLGMRGVLDRRMLCVTAEQVFAFERLEPRP